MTKKSIASDLAITLKCNGHCRCCSYLCDINMPDSSTMTVADVEEAMAEVGRFNQTNEEFFINEIRVLGGEPTLHPQLLQILECIKKHSMHVVLLSNMSSSSSVYNAVQRLGVHIGFSGTIQQKHQTHFMFPCEWQKQGYQVSRHTMMDHSCCDTFCIRKIEGKVKYFFCPCQASISIGLGKLEETQSDTLQEAMSIDKRKKMVEEMCPMCWFAYPGQSLKRASEYDMSIHCPSVVSGTSKFKTVK